ncbi:hypothetical protein LDO32_08805 [Luteimonas sp. Y-2-2-4F]|nr:hypothetical protein [Luteimonas sp. Y-2-2-4F]MCD9031607.1 hypothetical protein [Luteimonas sp. Y-2-2-4F]MCD9031818.1 hypothetical protein [Luteimonas sp. Y-2-2-4F]
MNTPAPASARAPMYIELAAPSPPAAGSAGAVLRDYLSVLAWYFEAGGAARTVDAVGQAFANLPGLVMQGSTRYADQVKVPPGSQAGSRSLAGLLAGAWGVVSQAARLSALTGPVVAGAKSAPAGSAPGTEPGVPLIVLQRPRGDVPLLGYMALQVSWSAAPEAGNAWPSSPQRLLSVAWTSTTYALADAQSDAATQFVAQMRAQGRLADLSKTAGFLAIPLS